MLKKSIIIVLALLLNFSATSQNQKKIDSLLQVLKTLPDNKEKANTLERIARSYLYNSDKSGQYYQKLLSLSEKIGYSSGIARGTYNLGSYNFSIGNYNKALEYYEKFTNRDSIDPYDKATGKQAIAIVYQRLAKYDEALDKINENIDIIENEVSSNYLLLNAYSLKNDILLDKGYYNLALKTTLLAEKLVNRLKTKKDYTEDPEFKEAVDLKMPPILIRLAYIEYILGRHEDALKHRIEAYKLIKNRGNKYQEGDMLSAIGDSYCQTGEYKKAEEYYLKAIDLFRNIKNEAQEASLLSGIALTYINREQYNKALLYNKKALELAERNESKSTLLSTLNDIGTTYIKLNKPKKALPYLNRSVTLADSVGVLKKLKRAYLKRSEAHTALNNSVNALKDFKAHVKIKDSLSSTEKNQKIEELYIINETAKKEQQILIQKNDIQLLEAKNKVSNLQQILLALALALALITAYAFYLRNKRNKLAKKKAEVDLEYKTKELTTHALHLAKKNEVLNDLKEKAKVLKADADADPGYQMLIQTINFDLQDDNNWENFSRYFEQVHKGFNEKAQERFPAITKNDLRLMALLKMNLSSKEIANILNISSDGIKKARQRLRKKMGIDSNDSLEAIVIAI